MRSALPALAEAEEVPMPLRFAASTPQLGESHAAPTPRRPARHATSDLGPAFFTTARECDESMANDFFRRLSPTLTRKGRPKNWTTLGNDILALPEITLTSMLQTLSSRFEKSIVYTNIGEILLSVNPFKPTGSIGPAVIARYRNEPHDRLPPHIYALMQRAVSYLQDSMSVRL